MDVGKYANLLLQTREGPGYEPVGDTWIYRFLSRHNEHLQSLWSKSLDTQRAQSLNPEAVKSWFDVVEKFVVEAGVEPENLYGMDESGFPMAYEGTDRVVGARGTKTQHQQGGADRENTTAVVTICADGTTVQPLLIFKGMYIKDDWIKGNSIGAYVTTSEKGWTDTKIGCNWLEHIFEPATREKAGGRTRVLLLDGHSSHYSIRFIEIARRHNIVLLGYPAHCTHALQGLDVVCFARMKENWKRELMRFNDEHRRAADKNQFTYLFSRAYQKSFTIPTTKVAFRVTGVHPFCRTVITEKQLKPSITTSTKGSFPLPQPSPVRAVMAAMASRPPTAFDLSPSTHTRHGRAHDNIPETMTSPSTPSLRRTAAHLDADPTLYTPSKRMRSMYAALASTSSGSILLSKAKITSSTPILDPMIEDLPPLEQPDWSLARTVTANMSYEQLVHENERLRTHLTHAAKLHHAQEGIIEGAHATMVIQNLHLQKLNGALYGKEKQREGSGRRLVIDSSKGQVFSSDEVLEGLRLQEEEKKAKEAAKLARADTRAAKKDAKAKLEAEWVEIKRKHAEMVAEWELTCTKLQAEGVPKKNHPRKLTRPRKPTLPDDYAAAGDDDDDEDDEEEMD
ncbi:hypothetical protein D9611_014093 [Ephemerocybe angulata]|uniref:DDE-1 domain-containing protein n=1 Tax=Ephemerocybe angulata TaxID=980116 RepID=A0A8H5B9K1_9AGAR|nr:hypothetical protein D9611_014093 [Tulosesus angulatus]